MKSKLRKGVVPLLALTVLAVAGLGCTLPTARTYPEQARQALITFFDRLSRGEYAQAAELYGGDYSQLQIFGPDLNPADRAGLWKNACEQSGLQCLPVDSATSVGSDGNVFTFTVEFRKPDGNVFALGPCCGEPGFLEPPMAEFPYRVLRTPSGAFLVLDLPVYMP